MTLETPGATANLKRAPNQMPTHGGKEKTFSKEREGHSARCQADPVSAGQEQAASQDLWFQVPLLKWSGEFLRANLYHF